MIKMQNLNKIAHLQIHTLRVAMLYQRGSMIGVGINFNNKKKEQNNGSYKANIYRKVD